MRFSLVAAAAALLAMQASPPAQAGLIGTGNSVQALFHWFDALGAGETVTGEPEGGPLVPTPLDSPVTIPVQVIDDASIGFADSQITITNGGTSPTDAPTAPFCSVAAKPCPSGEFWAFEFQFSPGIDVKGVTLDPATPADFQPTGTGIQLLSPTDVEVEVTNDNPAVGDQLILDLSFASTKPPAVPEPASIVLLGAGLAGLWAAGARRRARRA